MGGSRQKNTELFLLKTKYSSLSIRKLAETDNCAMDQTGPSNGMNESNLWTGLHSIYGNYYFYAFLVDVALDRLTEKGNIFIIIFIMSSKKNSSKFKFENLEDRHYYFEL